MNDCTVRGYSSHPLSALLRFARGTVLPLLAVDRSVADGGALIVRGECDDPRLGPRLRSADAGGILSL